jgi:hypothetical protein
LLAHANLIDACATPNAKINDDKNGQAIEGSCRIETLHNAGGSVQVSKIQSLGPFSPYADFSASARVLSS